MGPRKNRKTRIDCFDSSCCSEADKGENVQSLTKASLEERMGRFRFPSFDPSEEEWEYYVLRFENELAIHGFLSDTIPEAVKRRLFLARIGPRGFKIVVDHFRPKTVNEISYSELKQVLYKYYTKSSCVLAERMTFTASKRREDESVTLFLAGLRAQAGKCEFGGSLDERLRDQLVIGINDTHWQQEVLKTHPSNEASLEQVEQTLICLERAQSQQQKLKELVHSTTNYQMTTNKVVDQTSIRNRRQPYPTKLERGKDCFGCCGRVHRNREKCPALGQVCSACKGKDHFARACLKTGRAVVQGGGSKERRSARKIECAEEEDNSFSETPDEINAVTKGSKGFLEVKINDKKVEMLYDPGACETVISEALWKRIGSPSITPSKSLKAYTEVEIETLGKAKVTVSAFGKRKKLSLYVVKAHEVPLFGFSWTLEFGLPLPPGLKICSVKNKEIDKYEEVRKLKEEFRELFKDELGKVQGYKANILSQEEVARLKAEKRQRDLQRKQRLTENRKHLTNVRVVQRNLVFVVGLPVRLADPEVLKKHEYFVKFGKILKVVINQSTTYAGSQGPSASAYVTYQRSEDALRAIQAVNNIAVDGRTVKTSLGTTKYCSHFLKNQACPKPDCMYLHELGDSEASFTKEEMQQGKHQEYEKKIHDQLIINC